MIIGYYDRYGYVIYQDDNQIYRAGNSPLDSQEQVPLSEGLSLKNLRKYCRITAKEYAVEKRDIFDGIFPMKDIPLDPNE